MQSRFPDHLTLDEKMDFELAVRAPNASFGFAGSAIVAYFFDVGSINFPLMNKLSFIMLILLNATRFYTAKKITKTKSLDGPYLKLLKSSIALNSIFWSLFTVPIFYETNFTGFTSFYFLVLLAAFTVASSISLAPAPRLANVVQWGLFVPANAMAMYLAATTGSYQMLLFSFAFLLFFIHAMKQNKLAYTDIRSAIEFEMSLIESNKNLKISQDKLAAETTKLIHSSRMASLGEMAGGIAHEINNPLFIMQGHIEHLRRFSATSTDAEFSKKVLDRSEKIITTIQRIAQIVKGLRLFSQQSDSMPMEPSSLQKIVQDTLDFCQEKLRANAITVKVLAGEDTFVSCRAVQISQVLINLINNSFDAINAQEDKWIEISTYNKDNMAYIKVRDSGKGLSTATQAKLFQPFFTTKEVGKGTGLGLSISMGIIQEHGGDISYDAEDPNTTFLIRLPIVQATSKPKLTQGAA